MQLTQILMSRHTTDEWWVQAISSFIGSMSYGICRW